MNPPTAVVAGQRRLERLARAHSRAVCALGVSIAGIGVLNLVHSHPAWLLIQVLLALVMSVSIGYELAYRNAARTILWAEQEVLAGVPEEIPLLSSDDERLELAFQELEAKVCKECRQAKIRGTCRTEGCPQGERDFKTALEAQARVLSTTVAGRVYAEQRITWDYAECACGCDADLKPASHYIRKRKRYAKPG